VGDFVHLLRAHGLRVSVAEGLDALHALDETGLRRRDDVKDALRASLIKERSDQAAFDSLFDAFFAVHSPVEQNSGEAGVAEHEHGPDGALERIEIADELEGEAQENEDHSHSEDESTDLRSFFDEERLSPSEDLHGDSDRLRLSLFAQELVLNRNKGALDDVLSRITQQLRVKRASNIFNPGGIAPLSDAEELPLEISATELSGLLDHLHDLDVDEGAIRELERRADDIIAGLPELLKEMLERRRSLEPAAGTAPDSSALLRILELSQTDQREMEAAIRRLAARLHGAHARRLRNDRSGRVSVRHTLRRNLRYGGMPFEPVLRKKHEQRPRLIVLCDVSLSTRHLARFWLHLIYRTQSLFSKVRTFVFVADTIEVTQVFEERELQAAVEEIFSGRLIDVDANSDFGRAARSFVASNAGAVNHKTTVVVLGDARNNGRPPHPEALAEIAGQARQLVWLTPEERWHWTLGGSDMALYEEVCDRVDVVRTIEQLGAVAEDLAGLRSSRLIGGRARL